MFARLAVALLVLAGCASSADAATRPLRIGLIQQPNTLDPLHAVQFFENYVDEAIFSALCVIDDRGEPSPDLALAVPTRANGGISADGKTITYHLRRNARWQDGVPLTSRDVAFTFGLMRDAKTNFPETSVYSIVERLETPDPYTVVLRLHAPWADATSQLFIGGQNGSIVPEHVLRNVTDLTNSSFESAPVGSGPYKVERWERGSRIVLEANPTYFRGTPHVDRVEIRFVPDANVLALQVKDGELDFSPQMPLAVSSTLRDSPALRVVAVPTYSDYELIFETQKAPFDDARVRRALGLAIDRKRIASTVFHGFATPDDDVVPPQSAFHTTDPALRPSGDPVAAGRLLDAAGWKLGADGLRHKGNATLSFTLSLATGYTTAANSAVQMQAMFHDIGVAMNLHPVLSNLLLATGGIYQKGDFEAALASDGYATSPDRTDTLTTSGLPPGRNYSRYSDREVDGWYAAARVSTDPARRRELYALIARRLQRDTPSPVVLWTKIVYVYNGALTGLRPEPVNSDFWNAYDWRFHP